MTVADGRKIAAILRRLWRVVHNCVAHPCLEVLPPATASWFHDWTAERAYPERSGDDE